MTPISVPPSPAFHPQLHLKRSAGLLVLLCLVLLLAACKPKATTDTDPSKTATPLPTTTAKDYPVVVSPACQVSEFEALRTRQAQGDLLAWDATQDRLAFIGPALTSNWFSGRAWVVSGPDFKNPSAIAPETPAFGSLVWSPDSTRLAFVSFRQPEAFTVVVAPLTGGAAIDLFSLSNARTDAWAGSKAIQEWRPDGTLRVLSSCGEDCDQTLSISVSSGEITPVGEQLRKSKTRLAPRANEKSFEPTVFPPAMSSPTWKGRISPQMQSPTWSPDGKKVAYIDNNIFAWVLLLDKKIQYQLDTPFVDVQELKWAPDSRYIAVRTDDLVVLFDTACK